MKKLIIFESFSGVGSQRMALRNIGVNYESVGISEVDRYALLSYDAIHNENLEIEYPSKETMLEEFKIKNIGYNFSTGKYEIPKADKDIKKLYKAHIKNRNFGDIRLIDEKKLPPFDFFTYSFPCKNISIAGSQKGLEEGSETQSSLLWECRRIINYIKPKYLMMENVKNLTGKKHMPNFEKWILELEEMGYNNYWKVLNGRDYGVAQNRERVIMISILKEYDNNQFKLPTTNNKTSIMKDILELEPNINKKYYVNKSFEFTDKFYKTQSGSYNNILEVAHTDCTYSQNARIYGINGISPTLSARDWKDAKKILVQVDDGYAVRKLIPLEYWRLQGFSDRDFYKSKDEGELSNTKLYERAGRGIVLPMLEEIFKDLFSSYIDL